MSIIATVIGLTAAVCTTAANLPQLKKAWTTGETDDLSLKTLLLFGAGLSLWIVYGFFQKDVVIILANGLSLVILSVILYLKLISKMSWFLTFGRVRSDHTARTMLVRVSEGDARSENPQLKANICVSLQLTLTAAKFMSGCDPFRIGEASSIDGFKEIDCRCIQHTSLAHCLLEIVRSSECLSAVCVRSVKDHYNLALVAISRMINARIGKSSHLLHL